MYTEREYDIMLLETQEENDKLLQEVALELLGNRAKRMVKNGEIGRGDNASQAGPNAPNQAAAVAGAINTVAGAITTGPGGQVGRGSIGVGDWRNLAVNIPSAIPTRTVGPAGRAGLPAGAGFTAGMAAQGGTQRLLTARYGAPTGQQAETQRILAGRYGASRTAAMQAAQQDREQAYVLMARYGMAPPALIPGTSSYQERPRTLTARYSAH